MDAIWVGVDVSKQRLDVAIRPAGEVLTISNDEAGIKALTKMLKKWSPQLIVLEATGGHEYAAAYSLMMSCWRHRSRSAASPSPLPLSRCAAWAKQ